MCRWICPADQRLSPRYKSKSHENVKFDYCNRDACQGCALKLRCTNNPYRCVSRLENEAVLDRTVARLAARPDITDRRRESVEHQFGTIKQWMYQGAFLMRRLEDVRESSAALFPRSNEIALQSAQNLAKFFDETAPNGVVQLFSGFLHTP